MSRHRRQQLKRARRRECAVRRFDQLNYALRVLAAENLGGDEVQVIWHRSEDDCIGQAARQDASVSGGDDDSVLQMKRRRRDRIAEELLRAEYLYSGYTVDSRGPLGCIRRALREVRPDLAARLSEGEDVAEVYRAVSTDPDD